MGRTRIFIEREGRMFLWDKSFDSQEQLEDMIQQIVSRVNRMVNVSNPIVDAPPGRWFPGACSAAARCL